MGGMRDWLRAFVRALGWAAGGVGLFVATVWLYGAPCAGSRYADVVGWPTWAAVLWFDATPVMRDQDELVVTVGGGRVVLTLDDQRMRVVRMACVSGGG